MYIQDFPNCCTAKLIYDLGSNITPNLYTKEEIISYIRPKLLSSKQNGMATIVVTTMSKQTNANAALKELGFKHSRWMSKKNHKDTRLRVWWLQLDELEEPPKPQIPYAAQPMGW